jgi:pimeloyl-ACP methyl ester carboxylesterase
MRLLSSPRWSQCVQVARMALVVSVMVASVQLLAQAQGTARPVEHPTFYRTTQIDGLSIFYREAGPKDAPTLLLLHGLPSSSRMFEPLDAYPKWQAWMREKQPRLLVLWGKYDLSFEISEPEAYRRDVPKAELHVLDAGHFALDTAADQIAQLVRGFMK